MYFLNKIIWFWMSPLSVALLMAGIGIALTYGRRRRWGWTLVAAAVLGLTVFSMPITAHVLGHGIERRYRELAAKDFPCQGDVALDLGGSWMRSWYAAELVKSGKAQWLIPSAVNIERLDVPLIRDLGVPPEKILVENKARNTEENVKFAKSLLGSRDEGVGSRGEGVKVLLVTSAVHMPRSLLMMRKYWPEAEVIPAPCDFQTTRTFEKGWTWELLRPSLVIYCASEAFLHEYVGYVWYRWFRSRE